MGDWIRLGFRRLPRKVVALLGAHLTVVLASTVGVTGVAVGLFLPPGGTALAWFIPLVEGATVLSVLVVGAMAGIDVIVRQERSALPYVGIGATVATLWLAHLFSFTGLLLPTLIGARDGGLLFHLGRIAMPALLVWALLQAPGSLSNPRRAVTMVVLVALTAVGAAVGVTMALDPILRSLSLARHFTDVNTALLSVETIVVATAGCLFALGRRGDPRFAGALTGALILLGFEAITQALSKVPFDAAWYGAAALRLDPALLLMAGLLSLCRSTPPHAGRTGGKLEVDRRDVTSCGDLDRPAGHDYRLELAGRGYVWMVAPGGDRTASLDHGGGG